MPYFAPGKLFTDDQRKLIIQTNKAVHGGTIVTDDPSDPQRNLDEKGAANAPEIDHIIPKSVGHLSQNYSGISKAMVEACVSKLGAMVTDGDLELKSSGKYKLKK